MSILTPVQKRFLDQFFATFLGKEFFLSGGTALSEYYLQHRLSQDLDIFTVNQEITFDAVNAEIRKIIDREGLRIESEIVSDSFLRYILKTNGEVLKVDLVKDVPVHFGEIKNFGLIRVDSVENIAVGKLLALFGRADPKDFIDLFFLLGSEKKLEFDEVLKMAKQKDLGLQELFLAEMIYKAETLEILPPTIKPFVKKELVQYFTQLGESLLKKIKPTE